MLTTCPPEDIATVIFLALPTQLDLCDLSRGKMWKPGAPERPVHFQVLAGGDCLRNTLGNNRAQICLFMLSQVLGRSHRQGGGV